MSKLFVINENKEITHDNLYDGFVFFYKKSKDAAIAEAQTMLFSGIIEKGLKYKTQQFLWVDISTNPVYRFINIKNTIGIKKCFLFGVDENEIGLNMKIPVYKLETVNNVDFIKCDAPEVLAKNAKLKSNLWNEIQKSFNLI